MDTIFDSAVNLTRELVRIPSESSGSGTTIGYPEYGVAAVLLRQCSEHDIAWQFQEVLPDRHNFIASFPKPGAPRILFLAHMDTVSVKGMKDPFSAALNDKKIWGRGTCDDKGSLATVFAVLIGLKKLGVPLNYDVTLAATVDEECSMSGSAILAKKNPLGWDLCVGMEPTLLQPVSTHRGVYRCRILAPKDAAFPVQEILADLLTFQQTIEKTSHPKLGKAVVTCTEIKEDEGRHRILLDIRLLPTQTPATVHAQIVHLVGKRGRVIPLFAATGIDTDPETSLIKSFQTSLTNQALDNTLQAVMYSTDCSQLSGRGPCLVWGPGNPEQAHQTDEFIELEQIQLACRVLIDFFSSDVAPK